MIDFCMLSAYERKTNGGFCIIVGFWLSLKDLLTNGTGSLYILLECAYISIIKIGFTWNLINFKGYG